MKKILCALVLGLGLFTVQTMSVQADETLKMYRLYNPNSGEHFYTGYTSEKNHLVEVGWKYEGIAWYASLTGNLVYRLYNPNSGDHHYTMSYVESQNLIQKDWKDEEIGWYGVMPETTDESQSDDNLKNPSAIEQGIFKIINEEREKTRLDAFRVERGSL